MRRMLMAAVVSTGFLGCTSGMADAQIWRHGFHGGRGFPGGHGFHGGGAPFAGPRLGAPNFSAPRFSAPRFTAPNFSARPFNAPAVGAFPRTGFNPFPRAGVGGGYPFRPGYGIAGARPYPGRPWYGGRYGYRRPYYPSLWAGGVGLGLGYGLSDWGDYGWDYPYDGAYDDLPLAVGPDEIGGRCETPVKMCTLIRPSSVGVGCSCRVPGGRARGVVVP